MEINLDNLTEPLTKLIEVVSIGVGGAYKPLGTVLNANANSYAIKKLKKDLNMGVNELVITNEGFNIKVKEDVIESRAIETMIQMEVKKQINLDSIISKSIEFIETNKYVSDRMVNEDWINRFVKFSQDISDKEMQNIWAKLLCEEVKNPNSYSIRTLDILNKMTSNEAKLFKKFAGFTMSSDNSIWFCIENDMNNYLDDYGLSYVDKLYLEEIGLIHKMTYIAVNSEHQYFKLDNEYMIILENKSDESISIPIISTTTAGSDLRNLINELESDEIEFDIAYILELCEALDLAYENLDIKFGKYKIDEEGQLLFSNINWREIVSID